MKIALFALGLFATAFLFHWLLWRLRLPRRQSFVLLLIYMGALPLSFGLCQIPTLSEYGPTGWLEWLHVAISQTALALMYTSNYSALEGSSPTCMIALHAHAAGAKGCTPEELRVMAEQGELTRSRLDALYQNGMAEENAGRTRLTSKGMAWASTAAFVRKLLGIPKGR